jgi:hypothetical protein
MGVFRWIGIAIGLLVLAVGAVAIGARFADGPIAIFPGGPFRSGQWVDTPVVDWSFAADVEEIELQSEDRSRTTWILVLDGEPYVPCSIGFPPGKRWHKEALKRPKAVVRIQGKRYHRRLERVEDEALHARLFEAARAKYPTGPTTDREGIWFFHLAPPRG